MPLSHASYLAAIEREGRRIEACAAGALDAPVPTCPGWTVASLLAHLGRVYRSVTMHVERRSPEMLPYPKGELPQGDALAAWFHESLDDLLGALREIGPDERVWSWGGTTAQFYFRRMAHETVTHRVDVERATGDLTPLDSDLAADGVEELYAVVLPSRSARGKIELPSGSLHLHRADGEGEWMLKAIDDAIVVTHEHGKGDAAVRGPAGDLFLFVWNRGRADSVQVFGDESIANAWASLAP